MFMDKLKGNFENLILAAFWLILGGYVCYESIHLGFGKLNDPGSGFLSLITGILIIVFTVVFIIQALSGEKDNTSTYDKQGFRKVLIVNALFFIYILLISTLGFMLVSFLFLFMFFRYIESISLVKSLSISLSTVISIYLIFTKLLELRLPEGILI